MIEKAIASVVEPLVDEIVALEKRLDSIELTPGKDGVDGKDGLGIELKQWEQGIYREGSIVTAEIGKIFKATRDTGDKPGASSDWDRVGTSGFGWKGLRSVDAVYDNGDLYIDNGSTFIWWNGKGHMFTQRGKAGNDGAKGEAGKDGQDASYIVAVKADAGGFHMAMSDGEVHTADIEGFDSYLDTKMELKLMNWLDSQSAEDLKFGTPFKIYRGQFMFNESYTIGDAVNYQGGLWLCHKHPTVQDITPDFWVQIAGQGGGGGGGGGGAGGIVTTSVILANSLLNMGNFGIVGVADPRLGAAGAMDAVNKQAMQAAIAAGSLYQGTYKPAIGAPNIPQLADTLFSAPVAGSETMKPAGSPAVSDKVKNLDVWFNLKGMGLDNFVATLAAPLQIAVTFSDGTLHSFLLPAGTYADVAAVERALNLLATGTSVKAFHGFVNGSDFWLGVETAAPLYATSIVGAVGGGFPLFAPGAASTVLNTYNWVVSTTDPNVPEYMPPGLPGIAAGTKVNNSDLLQYNANTKKFEIIRGGNLTQNFADQRYWQLQSGNMSWRDQPYNKGAVVYGQTANAWFVATQNIVQGTPEPGKDTAAAMWRKINSTYGSTIFFGKGDYDTTAGHQDAAHNWGMPAGTYPAGQQPLNGDSYFDVLSGTEVQFTVKQNAAIYTLTGTVGADTTNKQGADLGNSDLAGWPGTRTTAALPKYWKIVLGASQTPTTGAFAGKTFAAGTYLIGFSGDPDADNSGWFMVAQTGTAAVNWTVATPHPQFVADTVTAKVIYGYRRNFTWSPTGITGATEAAPVARLFLGGFSPNNAIYRITLTDRAGNGAVYELMLTIVSGMPAKLEIVSIRENTEHFISGFGTYWNSTASSIEVGAFAKSDSLNGRTFDVVVQSVDGDMARLIGKTGGDTAAIASDAPMKQFGAVIKVAAILSIDKHTYDSDVLYPIVDTKFSIPTYVPNDHGFRVTFGVGIIKYHSGSNDLVYGISAQTNPTANAVTKSQNIPGDVAWKYSETFSGISGMGALDQIAVKVSHTAKGGGNGDTRISVLVLVEDLGLASSLNQIPSGVAP